jgi:glutaminyl-peptide cyclotransferase
MRIAIIDYNKSKTKTPKKHITILILVTLSLFFTQCSTKPAAKFDPEKAFKDIEYQLSLGPRTTGSQAHQEVRRFISSELENSGWKVEAQGQSLEGKDIYNIIGKRGNGGRWIIIGAHYDSRLLADHDPDLALRNQPVPGANDGASGVAVLLELARILPEKLDQTIWLVFFDAEDNGNIPGYDWIMGSRVFVQNLKNKPDEAIIIDMIGDADLNIYQELNSDPSLTETIWKLANKLGYSQFISIPKYRILDDHIPFIEAGIPAVDIIDIDYPYYHTTQDTLDKVSVQSLEAIGVTLSAYILEQNDPEIAK